MTAANLFIDRQPEAFANAHANYLEAQAAYVRAHAGPYEPEASDSAVDLKVAAQSAMYAARARTLDHVLVKIRDFMVTEAPDGLDDCQRRLLSEVVADLEFMASGKRYVPEDHPDVIALYQRVAAR